MVAKIRLPIGQNIGLVWDMVWAQINYGGCQQQPQKIFDTSISVVNRKNTHQNPWSLDGLPCL